MSEDLKKQKEKFFIIVAFIESAFLTALVTGYMLTENKLFATLIMPFMLASIVAILLVLHKKGWLKSDQNGEKL